MDSVSLIIMLAYVCSAVDSFVAGVDLPLKTLKSRHSTESMWSTNANADEDVEYQTNDSNIKATCAKVSEETSLVAEDISGVGAWVDGSRIL